jgi:hypothetical protein
MLEAFFALMLLKLWIPLEQTLSRQCNYPLPNEDPLLRNVIVV